MLGYPEAPRAWGLTRGMARLLGLSLPQAVVDGWLGRDELAVMIARCDTCARHASCECWLALPEPDRRLPEFCPNANSLHALAPQPPTG